MDFSKLLSVLHGIQNSVSGTNGIETNVSDVVLETKGDSFCVTLFTNDIKKINNMKLIEVNVLEVAGFAPALKALRMPYKLICRSSVDTPSAYSEDYFHSEETVSAHEKDLNLLSSLVRNGDEHSKVLRGVQVWFEINAPRYWWQEFATYRIGCETLASESTMHSECRAMSEEELIEAKAEIKEGHMQKRVVMMSYQTLRRVYLQRRNHRLPHWKEFCKVIETLPFAKEFILTGIYDNEKDV